MREILFRGKHIHTISKNKHLDGTWIYGYLCNENHIYSPELEAGLLIDKETICQYTGLTDKNGRKIFEGDIFRYTDEVIEKEKVAEVKYNENHATFCRFHKSKMGLQYLFIDEVTANRGEIIGNIFDNSELLDVRISKFNHADDVNMALEIAKNAIKEIQQYRSIGTVDDFERLIYLKERYENETYDYCGKYGTEECGEKSRIERLNEYEAIGTVEECRKARENQREEKSVVFRLKKFIDYYGKLMENVKDLMDHVNGHPGGNYPCEYNLADIEEARYKILCEVIGDLRKEVDNSDQNYISDGWIPCSQRLPLIPEGEDDREFIVMINGADKPTALYCDSHGTWHDDDGNIYDVIAWQLFPEPYTE